MIPRRLLIWIGSEATLFSPDALRCGRWPGHDIAWLLHDIMPRRGLTITQ